MHARYAGSVNVSIKPYLNMGGNLKKIDKIFVKNSLKKKRKLDIINTNKRISEKEDNTKNSNFMSLVGLKIVLAGDLLERISLTNKRSCWTLHHSMK